MRRARRRPAGAVAGLVGVLLVGPFGLPAGGQPLTPAAITLSPACPVPTATGASTLTVTGVHFHPFTAVLVTFDAGPGGRPDSVPGQTDGFGRFTVTVAAGARPAGVHTVRADDFAGREASADLVLPCRPELALLPALGPPGFVTQVVGHGFPAGASVRLVWSPGLSGRRPVVADRGGGFRAPVLVFPDDVRGLRRLRAEPAPGSPAFGPAEAPFLVVRREFVFPGERR